MNCLQLHFTAPVKYFSDPVPTMLDVWFIGDQFLWEIFDNFASMRNRAYAKRRQPPYLYEFYNVSGHFQMRLSAVKGVTRLYNALIEALNAQKFRLPKYIVMVPDKDLIEQINFYSFGASSVISATLQWLVHQMELTVERKEEKIIEKRPGALPPSKLYLFG